MKYCIIGLGRFGSTLAIELARAGHEVLAIDSRPSAVEAIKERVSVAARADAADIEALRELGAHEVDAAAVCIGNQFEASLMAATHFKEFGIEKIYCRIINDVHKRLITMLEVTDRIQPEFEAASQFAKRLSIERAKQHFEPTGDYTLLEVEVPERLVGKRLRDARLREDHGINLVTIRSQGDERRRADDAETEEERDEDPSGLCDVPDPDRRFESGDYLVIFGHEKRVEAFSKS